MKTLKDTGLPKSFNHWLRVHGIRPRNYTDQWAGKGRRFRINCNGYFQMGDGDFDRWANSVAMSCDIPMNRKDMDKFIASCVEKITEDNFMKETLHAD